MFTMIVFVLVMKCLFRKDVYIENCGFIDYYFAEFQCHVKIFIWQLKINNYFYLKMNAVGLLSSKSS